MGATDQTVNMRALNADDTHISDGNGAVVDFDDSPIRHNLKTAQGAWVELREPSHAEVLRRQGMLMRMRMQVSTKRKNEGTVDLEKDNLALAAYDYKTCVARHNLTHKDGRRFDLANPIEIQRLSTKVGQELDTLIGKLIEYDEDAEGKSSET